MSALLNGVRVSQVRLFQPVGLDGKVESFLSYIEQTDNRIVRSYDIFFDKKTSYVSVEGKNGVLIIPLANIQYMHIYQPKKKKKKPVVEDDENNESQIQTGPIEPEPVETRDGPPLPA